MRNVNQYRAALSALMLAFSALLAGSPGRAATLPPTNVVFIMTDDQAVWSVGCYGNQEAQTPAIDRLATQGLRLTRAFATIPVCSPARATVLTGRAPCQHGIHDWLRFENTHRPRYCLQEETLITDVLSKHGYDCGLAGKWHLGDSMRVHPSFSYWFTIAEGSSPYQDAPAIFNGKKVDTKGYLTDRITDHAVEFIESRKEKPFFLLVTYNAPHTPYNGHPAELVDRFKDCPFASIPNVPTHPWSIIPIERIRTQENLAKYFAACTGVDRGVDRIVRKLDDLKLSERTLVIYTSDQGFCFGHHGLYAKGNASNPRNMYDTSLQVPLIVRQPGRVPVGKTTDVLFDGYDFVPTLLDYMGLPPSPGRNLPGRSFAAAFEGKTFDGPDAVFGEYGRARMIRTAEWKLVHRADGGPHELYHLAVDPNEDKNLADEAAHRPRLLELRKRLFAWFEKYAEAGSDPVGNEYLRWNDKE